jgi:hypothetical protein
MKIWVWVLSQHREYTPEGIRWLRINGFILRHSLQIATGIYRPGAPLTQQGYGFAVPTSKHQPCYNLTLGGSTIMANLSGIVKQLKKERDRVAKHLSGLNAVLTAFAGVYGGKPTRKRRKMSAKSRAKIAAAQRARWAKFRKGAKK